MSLKPKNMKTTTILAIVAIVAAIGAVAVVSGMSMQTAKANTSGDTVAKCKGGLLSGVVCKAGSSQSNVNTGSNTAGR
jgi:hypothetical protein